MTRFSTLKKAQNKSSFRSILIEELIKRSWWVFLFIISSFMTFHFILDGLNTKEAELKQTVQYLIQSKYKALEKKDYFLSQIQSQSDPLWVEMILKKEFGLVSEGQTKVQFIDK